MIKLGVGALVGGVLGAIPGVYYLVATAVVGATGPGPTRWISPFAVFFGGLGAGALLGLRAAGGGGSYLGALVGLALAGAACFGVLLVVQNSRFELAGFVLMPLLLLAGTLAGFRALQRKDRR